MQASLKDYLLLHLIVLIWGFTAILGVLISLPALELVFLPNPHRLNWRCSAICLEKEKYPDSSSPDVESVGYRSTDRLALDSVFFGQRGFPQFLFA